MSQIINTSTNKTSTLTPKFKRLGYPIVSIYKYQPVQSDDNNALGDPTRPSNETQKQCQTQFPPQPPY